MPVSDLDISTNSASARSSLIAGIDGFNRWRVDAMGHIDAAIESATQEDTTVPLAHVAKGIILYGGRNRKFRPMIEQCAAAASDRSGLSEHEKTYVDVLNHMLAGRLDRAVSALDSHLRKNPTDVFAHRLIQQELFWSGDAVMMKEVGERSATAFDGNEPDYSTFLSCYAFSLEEAGDRAKAEITGREAISLDPNDPWGAHAVAHVMEMDGRNEDGIEWLNPLTGNWTEVNQMKHHLWWHLGLFCLEAGDHSRILKLIDEEIRNPESPLVQAMPDAYIDIQNVASMLMRLQLRGVDVGDRWSSIADVCAERLDNHESPFTSAHAAMTLAATGRFDEASGLLNSIEEFSNTSDSSLAARFREASLPAARGSVAWFQKDYQAVIDHMAPQRHEFWRMGGSHAQRDLFTQILFDASMKLDRDDLTRTIMEELATTGFTAPAQRTLYSTAA